MLRVQRPHQAVVALLSFSILVALGCGEGVGPDAGTSVHGAPPNTGEGRASSIQITPTTATVEEGANAAFSCTAFDSRGIAVSSSRAWSVSDQNVITVAANGAVTGQHAGSAVASCTIDGKTATATITVTESPVAFVELTPGAGVVVVGNSMQLVATPRDSNGAVIPGRQVQWSTADSSVATVNSSGAVVGRVEGSADIIAMTGGKASLAKVNVGKGKPTSVASISLSVDATTLNVGQLAHATATTIDTKGNVVSGRSITWTVADPTVISSVSSGADKANVTGRKTGQSVLTATSEGVSTSATFTVALAPVQTVSLSLASSNILPGQTTQATASLADALGNPLTGRSVVITSLDPSIATVSSTGLVTAVKSGAVIIRATSEGKTGDASLTVGVPSVATIEVTLASPNLTPGQTTQATAVLKDANGVVLTGRSVAWASMTPNVATVSVSGVVTAVAAGSAAIRATAESKTNEATVTVAAPVATPVPVASVAVTLATPSTTVGQATQAVAVAKDANGNVLTGRPITWSSLTPTVATVSSAGMVTPITAGTATVRATVESINGDGALAVTAAAAPPPPPPPTGSVNDPAPPRLLTTSVSSTPSTGRIVHVAAGDNLQSAFDNALPGDRLLLAAGATYTGNFVIRPKSGGVAGGWITVQSEGSVTGEGARMTPSKAASFALPKLASPTVLPVISAASGAERWRFIGLEVTTAPGVTSNQGLIVLGDGSPSTQPRNLIFDRMYIHGTSTLDVRRCIALNSDSTSVIDSDVRECHSAGFDSQAALGWNGNGPFKLVNNYLEASTEVVGFGGADPSIPNLVPSDIEIRGNHITRPMSWKGGPWMIKNLLELKSARRVAISGNVMENSWPQAQLGWAFVIWSVNQSGTCTWCVVSDVLIQDNLIRNVAAGFQMSERYGVAIPMNHVAIRNNLLMGVDNPDVIGGGTGFLINGNLPSLTIEHNTMFIPTSTAFMWYNNPLLTNHVVRNNLSGGGNYPMVVSPGAGWPSVAGTGSDFSGNVMALGAYFGSTFPAGNMYPTSMDAIGLVGGGSAAYSVSVAPSALGLASGSPYKGKATDGTDPGANISVVLSATASAVVP